jgi:amidase
MIGVLGTAPVGDAVNNTRVGRHGGNMDAQVVSAGAMVTLPVEGAGRPASHRGCSCHTGRW